MLVDTLRFVSGGTGRAAIWGALAALTGVEFESPWWLTSSDQLIAWDIPAPPGYVTWKQRAFLTFDERWRPFFEDEAAAVDHRYITWGGVLMDGRSALEAAAGEECDGCIPALVDPAVTDAAGGDWYPDDDTIFGLVVNGEARAYPLRMMEVHELVIDTLGGRRVAMPYCTLCGSAQAFLVDEPPPGFAPFELRTSGLLFRSNKVILDLQSDSYFDMLSGRAVSGPLREVGAALPQVSVVRSSWSEWKAAHPETTIVASDGGIGRTYSPNPLGSRDARGPIFPIGEVDPRLGVQELVLGVEAASGARVAFEVAAARLALLGGGSVELEDVTLALEGGGLRAFDAGGRELVSHQAFWFAWSQFWPGTLLWTAESAD